MPTAMPSPALDQLRHRKEELFSSNSTIRSARRAHRARLAISGLIILLLGLQCTAVALHTDKSFPFQHYPMYAEAHGEGEHVEVALTVYGRIADGAERRISQEDMNMPFFVFRRTFVQAILDGDLKRVGRLLAPYERLIGARLISVRIENYPVIVTRTGPRDVPAETIKTLELGAAATGDAP